MSGGVNCGTQCSELYTLNTQTSLHAQASTGYFFGSYSVVDIDDKESESQVFAMKSILMKKPVIMFATLQ